VTRPKQSTRTVGFVEITRGGDEMNREFVAITVDERESRLWRVRLDKYLRPCRVEPLPEERSIDVDECVVIQCSHPAPSPSEILTILRRRYMYEHRRSA
jgi:hypothetical protein